jgi:predicted kinase
MNCRHNAQPPSLDDVLRGGSLGGKTTFIARDFDCADELSAVEVKIKATL